MGWCNTAPGSKRWLSITGSILTLAACGGIRPPSASKAIAKVDFSCRLPVGSVPTGAGGFISFPSGQFTADKRSSLMYLPGPDTWVAESRVLSPDGSAYVSDEQGKVPPSTRIHIVDAGTGRDRAVWSANGWGSSLGWQKDGIYFMSSGSQPRNGPEIVVIDPLTGAQRLAVPQPEFGKGPELFKAGAAVGGGAVWSTAGPLIRIDPANGKPETWATYQHGAFEVVGWDARGQILLSLSKGSLVRLLAPGRSEAIEAPGFQPPEGMPPGAVSDGHGTWAAGSDGSIWLLDTPGRMKRVAAIPLPSPPPPTPGVMDDMGGWQAPRLLIAGNCR